jgi:hypothetical protein
MKKLSLLLCFCCLITIANAKIWRVNNNAGVITDFTSAQQANDAASVVNDDTLYFESSINSYGDLTLNKRLVLIGLGHFLTTNLNLQATGINAFLINIEVVSGGGGSTIMVSFNDITLSTVNDVVIQRCYVIDGIHINSSSNTIIKNCYIGSNININSGVNTQVFNSIIRSFILVSSTASAVLTNNILAASSYGNVPTVYNTTYRNNIFLNMVSVVGFSNCLLENNIANNAQFSTANGNQINIDMSTVFINPTTGLDKDLQLKAGSPAIAAGVGGVNCGAFGGITPYKLSVIPPVPSIYKLVGPPAAVGSSMNVTISTRSNN